MEKWNNGRMEKWNVGRLEIANWRLPTAHCPLLTTLCSLPSALCPLPSALCPLLYAKQPNSIAEIKKTIILKQKKSVDFGIINILRQKHINPIITGIEENGKNEKYNKADCKKQTAAPNALPSTHYSPLSALRSLLTTHYSLLTTLFPLRFALCKTDSI